MLREIAPKIARLREEAVLATKPSISSAFRPKDVSSNAWYEKPSENTLQSLVLTPPPNIVPNKKTHHPVVAKLLEDAREDLQSLDSVSAKCLDLKSLYPEDYANAFVGISMPELFAVYAEMTILQDSNLFLHHENINSLQPILETLSSWKTIDADDEETQRIGNVYQRTMKILISNLLKDSVQYYYGPASFEQTDRAIRIYKNMLVSQSPPNATFESFEDTIVKCLDVASGRVTNGSLVQSLNARRSLSSDTSESNRALFIHFARLLKILISSNRWISTIPNLKDRITPIRKTQIITGLISVLEELWTSDTLLDINDKDEFLSHVLSRERWLRLVILISRHGDREGADALRPLLIRARSELASFDKENGEVRSLDTYRKLLLTVP